ncbi:hypothetical protein CFIO01_09504 [Colletotrichum fioriniae PJ7]|uniref:Uncharacterized protein n=1 Tax=Colletotrichum fioriniae PJ7 TaxID=1445577 RepID=A0A010QGM7_9PEZI|nr:hypothetical protein CFIO01_09504 [Colletotrichum fioriniae PJ7]
MSIFPLSSPLHERGYSCSTGQDQHLLKAVPNLFARVSHEIPVSVIAQTPRTPPYPNPTEETPNAKKGSASKKTMTVSSAPPAPSQDHYSQSQPSSPSSPPPSPSSSPFSAAAAPARPPYTRRRSAWPCTGNAAPRR